MRLASMTSRLALCISLMALFGVLNAEEMPSVAEYKYSTKRNHSAFVTRAQKGWLVRIEFDKLNNNRPSVARALHSTEAEQYLIISLCKHFKVDRSDLELTGLIIEEIDDKTDKYKVRFFIEAISFASNNKRSPENRQNDKAILPDVAESHHPPPPTVLSVEIAKALNDKLRRMPTRLSDSTHEIISTALSAATKVSAGWPNSLNRRDAINVVSELSAELDELAEYFKTQIRHDIRILTLDKSNAERSLESALESFYESIGKLPILE
jgi:hypothetical protein